MRRTVTCAGSRSPLEPPADQPRAHPAGLGPAPYLPRGNEDEDRAADVRVELWLISFYKDWISPLLPRACRFVPTCSSYGMQAYEEHGAARGFVLTLWRIVRCNPLGGSGFDPPRWPPPAWGAGSSSWWRETPFWREDNEPGPLSDGVGSVLAPAHFAGVVETEVEEAEEAAEEIEAPESGEHTVDLGAAAAHGSSEGKAGL